jgi:mRNA-degrading endonuclease RelE of RelBE toxin-antitoxin system
MKEIGGCMMLTILEMPTYVEDADKLLTTQDHEDLKSLLASNPEAGDLIPRAGGIRKVRSTQEKAAKGKRGGARVVYYYHNEKYPLALIAIYGKGEKIDLSARLRNQG